MALFDFKKRSASPVGAITVTTPGVIRSVGYHSITDAPEVAAGVWIISDLVASMPIHLMENGKSGDVRVHDALARKLDIEPWSMGTRQLWMQWIVSQLLCNGNAFVIPQTNGMLIADLPPAPGAYAYRQSGEPGYFVRYKGQVFDADNVLHFRLRPDPDYPWRGQSPDVQLQQVVESILQTGMTKTAYMSSEYKPPLIIAVNSDSNLADENERDKFIRKMLKRKDLSEPLIIPADMMNVSQAKPLSLTDLAIRDGVELDRRTVAAILDMPPFLLGVGTFNRDEYNNFIARRIMPIARGIEQELTKKLLFSETRYFRFNARSLYSYSLTDLANIAKEWRASGLMTGNEGRNWLDLPPLDGLDELVMLENYIPSDRLGDQKKLTQEDSNGQNK